MNKRFFLFLILIIGLTSCKWENKADYTPVITLSRQFLVLHTDTTMPTDTLYMGYSSAKEMDTVTTCHVGDTIAFRLGLFGTANNLVSFDMVWDSTLVRFFALDGTASANVISATTHEAGHLNYAFYPGYLSVVMSMRYVTVGTGNNTFSLLLNTDSEFSPRAYKFQQRVQ